MLLLHTAFMLQSCSAQLLSYVQLLSLYGGQEVVSPSLKWGGTVGESSEHGWVWVRGGEEASNEGWSR